MAMADQVSDCGFGSIDIVSHHTVKAGAVIIHEHSRYFLVPEQGQGVLMEGAKCDQGRDGS